MTVPFVDRLRQRAPVWAGWAAASLGLSVPVSTTADSVLLVLLLVSWAACGNVLERLRAGFRHPAVVMGGVFFLLILSGTLHGDSPFSSRIKVLSKYEDFLLPAIFLPVFADNEVRKRAVRAFGLISGVILLLSLMLAAGLIEGGAGFTVGKTMPVYSSSGSLTVYSWRLPRFFLRWRQSGRRNGGSGLDCGV